MEEKVGGGSYNEFKDSPLYAFWQKLFGKKEKKPAPQLPDTEYSRFQRLDDKIMAFFHFFANVSAIALCAILVIAFLDVVGAKLHKLGIPWIHGIANSMNMIKYCHIPLVFLTAGYVTLDQGHTRIDLLCNLFPDWLQKIFMLLGHLLGAALSFFISYISITNILLSDISKKKTITNIPGSGWPKWPFTFIHVFGFALLGLSFIWAIVRMIRLWKYKGVNPYYVMHPEKAHGPGAEPEEPAEDDPAATEEGGNEI